MLHELYFPNGGVAYVGDKLKNEIDEQVKVEMLKWLADYKEPKIKLYPPTNYIKKTKKKK
jgi:hypothetical protein